MLQRLQNMASRLICNSTRFCCITQLMFKLHCLPVKLRIKYKIFLMTYKAIHALSPYCIQSLVQAEKKSLYNLRSNDEVLQAPPTFKSNKTTIDRSFQLAAPFEWNKLLKSLRLEKDLLSFKTKFKTFLFQKAYYNLFFTFLLSLIYNYFMYFLSL